MTDKEFEDQCAMDAAIEECRMYSNLGGLDDTLLADIAFDNDVDIDDLKNVLNWDD